MKPNRPNKFIPCNEQSITLGQERKEKPDKLIDIAVQIGRKPFYSLALDRRELKRR